LISRARRIGGRIRYALDPQWTIVGYADIGAGGSDSTWQLAAGLDYAISPTMAARFGYRLLKVDYHRDNFLYDMSSGGLYAGVGMRF
jgi:opacity protein-like surface antigen